MGMGLKNTAKTDPYQWIRDNIFTLDAVGGIKPFPNYPYLNTLIRGMAENRILIVAKSRQMLATWAVCAWMLHEAIYGPPGMFLLLSKGARDTGELVKRLKVIRNHLPDPWNEVIKIKSDEVTIEGGSRIIALPATE